jgi:NAD-dependent SIR2 family protein deacetylase
VRGDGVWNASLPPWDLPGRSALCVRRRGDRARVPPGVRPHRRCGHLLERYDLRLRGKLRGLRELHTCVPVIDSLRDLLHGKRVCVLTGAGISTESGIPDYRGPGAAVRKRAPIQHREFLEQPSMRARYWARSMLGWPKFRAFEPNEAHRALAQWKGVTGLITQNVDRLHHKAGSQSVIELHGALADVRCMTCARHFDRDALQVRLEHDNAHLVGVDFTLFADGDADLPDDVVNGFVVPTCEACGGVLKPDVVFFGDSVPRPRVELAFGALDAAEVLLVVGSSLTVFSGYRFVLRAKERAMPIAVVNLGPTRADEEATLKLEARAGEVLPALARIQL